MIMISRANLVKKIIPDNANKGSTMNENRSAKSSEISKSRTIQVLIVEDHTIVRQGLIALLSTAQEIKVVNDIADGLSAIDYLQTHTHSIDVLVCDLALPGLSGIEVIERASALDIKCIALSMHHDPIWVQRALSAGASGYLLKGSGVHDLIHSIKVIYEGELFLSPSIRAAAESQTLTTREREVLTFVAQGHTSKEISGLLKISSRTVEHHRARLMSKLKINDIAGLTRYAIRQGLVDPHAK